MSYGVALRNGVPFTLGTIAALCVNATSQWSPLALWPNGASSPGMWSDGPSYPASCFKDSAGTTALSTVGTVLDSSNPVGLVLDRKAGATTPANPGIHLSQSTSAAMPVASARKNLLTSTDSLGAGWIDNRCTSSDAGFAFSGITGNAKKVVEQAVTNSHSRYYGYLGIAGIPYTLQARFKAAERSKCFLSFQGAPDAFFDLTSATVIGGSLAGSAGIRSLGSGEFLCWVSTSSGANWNVQAGPLDDAGNISYVGDPAKGVYVSAVQLELGSTATPYQRVGAASDYTATGFPAYLKFDGTDDALASATFAAGTLTSSMDCLIAVRRDSAGNLIAAYQALGGGIWFGCVESGSSSLCFSNSGSPTVWVDGVQLSGGTSVTRGTLHTALTPGAWHILEFRSLDLSVWTAFTVGNFTGGYNLNGGLGDILLFASGQDANRDKARAQMADYFGVTLPAWVGRYNYVTPPTSSIPVAGEIVHGDNLLNKLNFSKTDLDGQTYTGPPLTTGHEVKIGDQVYTLVAPPVDFSSYITLTIEPATQLADGTYPVLVY